MITVSQSSHKPPHQLSAPSCGRRPEAAPGTAPAPGGRVGAGVRDPARALRQRCRGPARRPAALAWLGPAPGPGSNPCSEHRIFLPWLCRATHTSEVKQKPPLTSTRKLQLLKCHLKMSCLPFSTLHARLCFIQNGNVSAASTTHQARVSPCCQ